MENLEPKLNSTSAKEKASSASIKSATSDQDSEKNATGSDVIANGDVERRCNGGSGDAGAEYRRKSRDGGVNGNRASESIHSIDVLSARGSEAGDTLNRTVTNNNNITTWRETALKSTQKSSQDCKYFIAKELLMTERTYKKDIEVITVWWSREVMSAGAPASLGRACLSMEPLALATGTFLAALERALSKDNENNHDNQSYEKVTSILESHLKTNYDAYMRYSASAGATVGLLEAALRSPTTPRPAASPPLSLALHLLRPLHRLLYYERILTDLGGSLESVSRAHNLAEAAKVQLTHAENHALLCQLRHLIYDYDMLVVDREFVRMGCAFRHTNTGLQQRMLFLFNDVLVVAARSDVVFRCAHAYQLQDLNIHAKPHYGFSIEDKDGICIYSVDTGREDWIDDISKCIEYVKERRKETPTSPNEPASVSVNVSSSSLNNSNSFALSQCGGGASLAWVCWHRDCSLSREQMHLAAQTHLSGYLLRKFKNSHGWQKLWVSFAVFTLYFYKSWTDESPLASLPLLGYKVSVAGEKDGIQKDLVMKLLFKNHVYYFRAESNYTFSRWMEVLSTATST